MRFLVVLALLAIASLAIAGEEILVADGGFRFAPITGQNLHLVEVLADGTATIYFVDSTEGAGVAANGLKRRWPEAAPTYGNADFALRTNQPRPFYFEGADSVYVDVTTATEVIVTWSD